MTDFKLPAFSFSFSFNVTKLNTSPELVIKEVTPLVKGHSTSHRLYSCLGCGKHVYICRRCDRGHQYCFDGCAISEPKKHARKSQQRYASKKSIKAKRAAYMSDKYQRAKEDQLVLKSEIANASTEPLLDDTSFYQVLVNLSFNLNHNLHDSFQYALGNFDTDTVYRLMQPSKRINFHPSSLKSLCSYTSSSSSLSNFLTDEGSFSLSPHAVITSSTYDITTSVLTSNSGQSMHVKQPHRLCSCCHALLPQLSRTHFLYTKIKKPPN